MELPGDAGFEELLLPSIELSDPSEGDCGLAFGELLSPPTAAFEGALVACEEPGVPAFEIPEGRPFALPASPRGWEGSTMLVGTDWLMVFCVALTIPIAI